MMEKVTALLYSYYYFLRRHVLDPKASWFHNSEFSIFISVTVMSCYSNKDKRQMPSWSLLIDIFLILTHTYLCYPNTLALTFVITIVLPSNMVLLSFFDPTPILRRFVLTSLILRPNKHCLVIHESLYIDKIIIVTVGNKIVSRYKV